MERLLIATKNEGKIKDFRQLFSKYGIEILSLLDLDFNQDIEETGTTFEENAAIKAETIAKQFQIPVLADDSGLEIDALDGRPGIYSARYAGEKKDDQANLHKVLKELKGIPNKDRTARFVCVLALARPNIQTIFKKGTCEGIIGGSPVGENGFGYDPIFYPLGHSATMAQMTHKEKNEISHRSNAIKQLDDWLSLE
ncbi:XTP/dITP diphosphatase [Aquibacillus halophilus]|uniref:dITP/XTP pyrophosphatase n=1 Tax=Aquibacillus halophilus TaxID=930132 RepID=A0A6A8DGG3_9BACI|nr:XTP/dITP diphosphatase [Aquibacillus halophilus]MRH42939.1 XTP/dITP diphosphatase [Aquibacillus halophilus]